MHRKVCGEPDLTVWRIGLITQCVLRDQGEVIIPFRYPLLIQDAGYFVEHQRGIPNQGQNTPPAGSEGLCGQAFSDLRLCLNKRSMEQYVGWHRLQGVSIAARKVPLS